MRSSVGGICRRINDRAEKRQEDYDCWKKKLFESKRRVCSLMPFGVGRLPCIDAVAMVSVLTINKSNKDHEYVEDIPDNHDNHDPVITIIYPIYFYYDVTIVQIKHARFSRRRAFWFLVLALLPK